MPDTSTEDEYDDDSDRDDMCVSYAYVSLSLSLSMFVYICVCIYVCVCVYVCVCMYVCMCVCMYACMCVYMYVCTYTCSHTYIYALYILHMLLLLTHTSVHGINNTQRMSARHPLFHRLLRQAMLFRWSPLSREKSECGPGCVGAVRGCQTTKNVPGSSKSKLVQQALTHTSKTLTLSTTAQLPAPSICLLLLLCVDDAP